MAEKGPGKVQTSTQLNCIISARLISISETLELWINKCLQISVNLNNIVKNRGPEFLYNDVAEWWGHTEKDRFRLLPLKIVLQATEPWVELVFHRTAQSPKKCSQLAQLSSAVEVFLLIDIISNPKQYIMLHCPPNGATHFLKFKPF